MGKDLFKDLTADVSDKYKNKNDATILLELTERIDAIVKNLSRETREHLWAEVCVPKATLSCFVPWTRFLCLKNK